MPERTVQLVLHYDGGGFHGWQRQPAARTVQGVLEEALARLCGTPVPALGSGRTDAGVHARGQAVGVRVAQRWTPAALRRALNAVLPDDVWVADAAEMRPEFHARYSALRRRYSYRVGLDEEAASPFRRRYEWAYHRPVDVGLLREAAALVVGEHAFRAFAVQGTAPETDSHRCDVSEARWTVDGPQLTFHVEANRFLHHMVRFLVGTMLDVASGRRPLGDLPVLLQAESNRGVSPPAPPHALVLERVTYPEHLYHSLA
ncbi:MAG TPA: tRNA pseudouridine(38-40) synthase TruA [Gemmatimonadaceae bacterium]|nr:tRNA pseudouridine(38-40) synthase TruA [Gemmatimonadaceae bacterium]